MSVLLEQELGAASTVAGTTGRKSFSVTKDRERIHEAPVSTPAKETEKHIGFSLHFHLNPATVLLSIPVVAVLATVACGFLITASFGLNFFGREAFAASVVAIVGGVLSALPVAMSWRKDALRIAQCALVGIGLRLGTILLGTFMAMGPGWSLAKMPLAYWTLAMYFPLLAAETGVIAYISNRCDRK